MMSELREKLAKWAGFKYGFRYGWDSPDGSWCRVLPYFDESLDACFKWLVPKLTGFLYQYTITINNIRDGWACQLYGHTDNPYIPKRIDETGETPALALCKAIEKLIDEGGQ